MWGGRLVGNMKFVHGYLSGNGENSHRHLGYSKDTNTTSLESEDSQNVGKVCPVKERAGGCGMEESTSRDSLEGSLGVLICVIGML